MAMQCDNKPRLLPNIQIQALAVELDNEVATMSVDILTIVSICGWISWNNSTTNWPASSLQHCARQVTEPGEANKPWNKQMLPSCQVALS